MFQIIGMFSLVGAALIAPGWFVARKRGGLYILPFFLPVIGIVFWLILGASGLGSPSLANLVELYGVVLVAIVSAYLKFFLFDKRFNDKNLGNVLAFGIVVAAVVAFRLCTPMLPE